MILKNYNHLFGPFLLLIAALTWALGNVLFAFVVKFVSVDAALFSVYAVCTIIIAPFFRPGKIKVVRDFVKQWFLMVVYYVTSGIGFAYSDPNDVTAIFMLTIFLTPILAR